MFMLKQDDLAKLVLRLGLGVLLFLHGFAKIGSTATLGFIKGTLMVKGLPTELAYGVFIGELVAPALLVLGLYSRIGAMIVVVNMFFVIWLVHMGELLALGPHGGWALELQGFFLITALAVMFLGSGKFAVKPD